jgi:hypothetical protein
MTRGGVALVAALASACASGGIDRIAVANAAFATEVASLTGEEADAGATKGSMVVDLQRIDRGPGAVVSRRAFSAGSHWLINDEEFEVMTVQLPRFDSAATFRVGSEGVRARYTRGAAAFPEIACVALAVEGTVQIEPEGERIRVALAIRFDPVGEAPGADCRPLAFSEESTYEVTTVDALTPWLGSAYRHVYDATYR